MALATRAGLHSFLESAGTNVSTNVSARGSATFGQKPFVGHNGRGSTAVFPSAQPRNRFNAPLVSASAVLERPAGQQRLHVEPAFEVLGYAPEASGPLPPALYRLLDPANSVDLPPAHKVAAGKLDNRELDKLVGALGRSRATWRRALLLHEWLLGLGHAPDDRLCTTLIRVCAQHGQALSALNIYDWMRARVKEGGAGLCPTVFTYTAAMRAALSAGLVDRALKVWEHAEGAGCEPDCRMCTTLIEVATRKGDTLRALAMYERMRAAPPGSRLVPSVHAFTAAMRAAAEGGAWERALEVWADMDAAGCRPTGHAYAAAITACAAGGCWERAVALFDEMLEDGVRPDVVSCTALVAALGADGQWQRAERVVAWMLQAGVRPNVRTYTALVTALGNGGQWQRALDTLAAMRREGPGGHVEPNAYTYSALLKAMGEQGECGLAERVFAQLEVEALAGGAQGNDTLAPGLQGYAAVEAPAELRGDAVGDFAAGPFVGYAANLPGFEAGPRLDLGFSHFPSAWGPIVTPAGGRGAVPGGQASGAGVWQAEAFAPRALEAGAERAGRSESTRRNSFGAMPTLLAEQVLSSPSTASTSDVAALPDDLPGQSNTAAAEAAAAAAAAGQGLLGDAAAWGGRPGHRPAKGMVNEVVCGAMMLAYERSGRWSQALGMLQRAERLGIAPNTIMLNTALSALAKAGRPADAAALFARIPAPDAASFETLLAAHGLAGQPLQAEAVFAALREAGWLARDYAFCGLVAAHSLAGDARAALGVRGRMRAAGVLPSVHVYNALIAACERAHLWDKGLELGRELTLSGLEPNTVTRQLLSAIGRGGVACVGDAHLAVTALTAAVAAAGSLAMRSGLF
ncbi:hypothetical protein WJX81_006751 [Elliptochloris bilobata]|uniref:PROP1-like PPR domain-containing protein n=1 Tax=Elliptochloris bilobata TaxID=381761 RepID=A0AAW1R1A8_9CHLO